MSDYLAHVGKGHLDGGHSGRYPFGSGSVPYQHAKDFVTKYNKMRSEGLSKAEIAKAMGMSQNELQMELSYRSSLVKTTDINRAAELRNLGYSNREIGEILNPDNPIAEGTIRGWLKNDQITRSSATRKTADDIASVIEEKGFIDVGKGVEAEMGVTVTHLNTALTILKNEGYDIREYQIPNASNPTNKTTVKVIGKEDANWDDIYKNPALIESYTNYIEDGGLGPTRILQYPESLDSSRLMIRYSEEGGLDRDGVIELRRGVDDVSLGNKNYAQVRIAVDDDLYLKGMAIYSDNLPDGVDVLFNTNKTLGTPKEKVLKSMRDENGDIDINNPFGATIKPNGQTYFPKDDGKYVVVNGKYILDDGSHKDDPHYGMSVCNMIKAENDWEHYSKSLSSQFLSKQPKQLIDQQLKLSIDIKESQYENILAVENPTVRKYLLNDFADACDKAAVDLKAASLPRQSSKVILPVDDIPEGQIYAPTYKNGETVYLVRYPHGSTSEIPKLVVNNNWESGKKIVGPDSIDAVGINKKTADQLSGADFDGDSVIVIPASKNYTIKADKQLKQLENFSTDMYKIPDTPEGAKVPRMTESMKGREMGVVANLLNDMQLRGAPDSDIAMALKHSMVVIDAPKHGLDYKQSERDNEIERLKKEYQPNPNNKKGYGGASTLISKSKSEERIPKVKRDVIDPETGEKNHIYSNEKKVVMKPKTVPVLDENGKPKTETYVDKKGRTRTRTITKKEMVPVVDENGKLVRETIYVKSTKMAETKDAYTLSSGHPTENAYAEYANKMKSLGNRARKEALSTKNYTVSQSAADTYATEVGSLKAKLNNAIKSKPRERQAQIISYQNYLVEKNNNPDLTKEEKKKIRTQSISTARSRLGAKGKDSKIDITDKEWEAIQAHAVPPTTVNDILKNTDSKKLAQLSMPKSRASLSIAQENKIKNMHNMGFTLKEIADSVGVSPSTASEVLK